MPELNPVRRLLLGVYWRYNVTGEDGRPLKDWGVVLYVTDDFGTLTLVDRARSSFSLT